jgi:RNA polymerase sigma-70 factor (ECF subfamily)
LVELAISGNACGVTAAYDGVGDEFPHVLADAKDGSEDAFRALFRAFQPRLLRYLRALSGDEAEDIAADTWLNALRGLTTFCGGEHEFRAWLYTIARRRWVDLGRAAQRRPAATAIDPIDELDRLDRPAEDTVEAAAGEIISTEAAIRLVRRLPPEQAEVVLLRHLVGFDVQDTARILGKSSGAVRVLAHRGLRRLAVEVGSSPDRRREAAVTERQWGVTR